MTSDSHTGIVYASFVRRVLAFIIDLLMFACFGFAIALILAPLIKSTVLGSIGSQTIRLVAFIALLFLWPRYESSHLQATPGKILLGLKVCNEMGEKITYRRALSRFILKGLFGKLSFGVSYLFPLWTAKKQALHDLVVKTIVVHQSKN